MGHIEQRGHIGVDGSIMDASTLQQLHRLRLSPHRPLLICDVDGVLVRFIDALKEWLAARELSLHPDSWALEGNIRTPDGRPVRGAAFERLLHRFFAECTDSMPLMAGAAEALSDLARHGVQVVLLTNLPHRHHAARRRNLVRHGLDFPVITNSGPKGPPVRVLRQMVREEVAFVDDHPDFLHSASEWCPPGKGLHLVHFVEEDLPFTAHLPPLVAPHVKVRDWRQAHELLRRILVEVPSRRHASGAGGF